MLIAKNAAAAIAATNITMINFPFLFFMLYPFE
jgi:hypothetical protein